MERRLLLKQVLTDYIDSKAEFSAAGWKITNFQSSSHSALGKGNSLTDIMNYIFKMFRTLSKV